MKKKLIPFTCANCGRPGAFDPANVLAEVHLLEHVQAGPAGPPDAYLPTCEHCGAENVVLPTPPSKGKGKAATSATREALEAAKPARHKRTPGPPPRKTPEQLAEEQGVPPVGNPTDLGGDFWPADESADEFIEAVRRWRREGPRDPAARAAD